MKRLTPFMLVLVLLLIATSVVSANPGTQVYNLWSGYAWYNAAGKSGVVHERYFCDSNWENCPFHCVWYNIAKKPNRPTCDDGSSAGYFGYLWDVGDGSDILTPGYYWTCCYESDFRAKP